jgi:RNA polymerase sigma factor for flagellar operon FliA
MKRAYQALLLLVVSLVFVGPAAGATSHPRVLAITFAVFYLLPSGDPALRFAGKNPTDAEIAGHLGIRLGELHDIVTQISFVTVTALEEVVSSGSDRGESLSLPDTLADVAAADPVSGLEGTETRAMLSLAVNSLSEREKIVITLYYFEGLTLAEIGEVLGVTESRVCQIHTKAVGLLRNQLRAQEED